MVIVSTWIKGAQQVFKFETTTHAEKFIRETKELIPEFYVIVTEDSENVGPQKILIG